MNIVLFGDSFLGRFGKNLIDQLEVTIPDSTVYNCAAGGLNSNDLSKRADYIASLEPDYVIFSFGGNDVAPWKETVSLADFRENTKSIFEAFSNSTIIMLLCPRVQLESSDQTQQYNNGLSIYNKTLIELCDKPSSLYIDIDKLLEGIDDYHEDDGIHFNQQTYDKVILKIGELIH
jgi:lysophospholipase L1-like esterase